MARQDESVYFTDGCLRSAGDVCIAAKLNRLKPTERFERAYFHKLPDKWLHAEFDWHIASVCCLDEPRSFWILARTGEVRSLSSTGHQTEQIKNARKYGPLRQIRAIGATLYTCGDQGQVYRRGAKGWALLDESLLDPVRSETALHLRGIDGTSESDLFAVGSGGRIVHYDGARWRSLASPIERDLERVVCVDGVAYACGARGAFVRIQAGKVEDLSSGEEDFVGIAAFEKKVYLATRAGLFTCDGRTVAAVDTGLGAIGGGRLDAKDGQLWSFGRDDLVYYDGSQWRRLLHPANQPPAPAKDGGLFREVDHQQAMALIKKRAGSLANTINMERLEYSDADDDERWTVRVYDGDYASGADYSIDEGIVVFAGDLSVDGTLTDCGKVDHTLTVVLGDLRVKNAMLSGEWLVAGEVHCEGMIFVDSLNDYTFTVGRDLSAAVFVNEGTYSEVRGALRVKQALTLGNSTLVGPGKAELVRMDLEASVAATRTVFPAELHSRHGTPDEEKLRRALGAGQGVLLRDLPQAEILTKAGKGARAAGAGRSRSAVTKKVAAKSAPKKRPATSAKPPSRRKR